MLTKASWTNLIWSTRTLSTQKNEYNSTTSILKSKQCCYYVREKKICNYK